MSLFHVQCFHLCQSGNSTGRLNIYTNNGSKYCARNKRNTVMFAPRRHNHPSRSVNGLSDIAVIVNIDAEFKLIAVNPMTECCSMNHICE